MKKGYLYIVATAVIFSTMELVSKTVATEINPIQLNFLRFLIGALVLLPSAISTINIKKLRLTKDDWLFFLFSGFLGVTVSMTLFQFAVMYAMASITAVIFSVNPIFTAPLARVFLNEKLTNRVLLSLAVSVAGIMCILNPFALSPFELDEDLKGILLALLSALVFALYSVLGKKRASKYGSVVLTCFSFFGGVVLLLIFMLASYLPIFDYHIPIFSGIESDNILTVLYLGVVVTGLGYLSYFKAIEQTSAITGSIAFFIKPAVAPILCFLLLGEDIAVQTLGGIILILGGAYINLCTGKKQLG